MRKKPPRVLVTVPHACSSNPKFNWYCDDNSREIGEHIADELRERGYEVRFIHTDAFRGIVDANTEEGILRNAPSGNDIEKRMNLANKRIQEMKRMGVVPNDLIPIIAPEAIEQVSKATSFRGKIRRLAKDSDIHVDVHSFGGCDAGIKNFECKDVAILDLVFYKRDNKMSKEVSRALRERGGLSSGKFMGSRANDVIVSNKIPNSVLVEFNRDFIESTRKEAFERRLNERKKELVNEGLDFVEGEIDGIKAAAFDEAIASTSDKVVTAIDDAIRKIKKREPSPHKRLE